MNNRISKTVLAAITATLGLAAGLQGLLLLVNSLALQANAPDSIASPDFGAYMLGSCRAARMFGVWSFFNVAALCFSLPSFWFAARRLGSAWRAYHISSLTLGCGVMAFYWLVPMIYKVI